MHTYFVEIKLNDIYLLAFITDNYENKFIIISMEKSTHET